MPRPENEYIELCKRLLETKFSFGIGYGHSRRDLELLSNYLEEEKGVYISLSTLKRLWKNNFKQGPQLATLNALVRALDYDSWQQFKLKNPSTGPTTNTATSGYGSKRKSRFSKKGVVGVSLAFVLFLTSFLIFRENGPNEALKINEGISIIGPIVFETNKTLTKGVPNTSIFRYDVSNVLADSFFIQQSWNESRKERIDPEQKVFSSIYHESGFHRAKLIANDSIIAMKPVHIISDGWEPHLYYDISDERFVDFKGETFIEDGQLHLKQELLAKKNVDVSKSFKTRISHSREYGVSSDNFSFNTKMKVDEMNGAYCPWMDILLITEKHIFRIKLVQKGCEVYSGYKLGEITKLGRDNDLSTLGQNIYQWQEIGIEVKNKKAEININGKSAYNEQFNEDFGNIMGLTFIFEGKGSIEHVKLSDAQETISFEDDFVR